MAASRLMSLAQIERFFQALADHRPEPRTELMYHDPFTLLVAVVLSAQSTDKGVNKVTASLFQVAPTPHHMKVLGEEKIREHIKTLGLYKNKARHIYQLSCMLLDRFQGQVPHSREALESLPGVGRKTANVVLNVAFGEPTIPVDTHIFRVACRTGLAPAPNVRAVEKALMERVPDAWKPHAHHWLVLHGRYTCKARKPLCLLCPVRDVCQYDAKTPSL